MSETQQPPVVVGWGPVDHGTVLPVLGTSCRFVAEPTDEDLAVAEGAIVRADQNIDRHALDRMPRLRVIARTGVGVDRVDVNEAARRGIPVVITPEANTRAVAEGALAHLLAVTKNLSAHTSLVREGQWATRDQIPVGDLDGGRLAVLGFGRIGRRVAHLARAFGAEIIAYDPGIEQAEVPLAASVEEAVTYATHISIHLPSTADTRGMINSRLIGHMTPGVIVVNLARGDVMNLDDVHAGLTTGVIAGVGVDVYPDEPPAHHPLFDHPRVVLTPHVMGLSAVSAKQTFRQAAQGIVDVLSGRPPSHVAHPTIGETL